MKYRLIAFDLDGTLLDGKKNIPPENMAALKAAAEQGMHIVPATGRIYAGLPQPLKDLPFLRWCITVNGAYVYDALEDKAVYREDIPMELALRVIDYMEENHRFYDCYKDNWGYIDRRFYEHAVDFMPDKGILDLLVRLRTPVESLRDYIQSSGTGVQKLQMYFTDMEERTRQLRLLPERFPELAVTSSVKNNIELNWAAANKGTALEALCRHLGVTMEETIAFGDGTNDLTMLRAAGLGVAMGNAAPEVKAAAGMVTDDNEHSGVAKVIREIL